MRKFTQSYRFGAEDVQYEQTNTLMFMEENETHSDTQLRGGLTHHSVLFPLSYRKSSHVFM